MGHGMGQQVLHLREGGDFQQVLWQSLRGIGMVQTTRQEARQKAVTSTDGIDHFHLARLSGLAQLDAVGSSPHQRRALRAQGQCQALRRGRL